MNEVDAPKVMVVDDEIEFVETLVKRLKKRKLDVTSRTAAATIAVRRRLVD